MKLSLGEANSIAYDLLGLINVDTMSYYRMTEFPGMDALGLDCDNEQDNNVADAIIFMIRTVYDHRELQYDHTESFGRLSTMIQYSIVDKDQIETALSHYYDYKNKEKFSMLSL